jgi:nucleoside-diphosphate-sugar epimerase
VSVEEDTTRLRPPGSEVERLCASNAKAKRLLGWAPKVTLEEGLARVIEYVRANLHRYKPDMYVT